MPLIRWKNRAVTAITPHSRNRTVLIPPYKGTGTPPAAPSWTSTPAPPNGTVGVPYSYDLTPHLNTVQGVVITVTAGSLPTGLAISGRFITGTPTTDGTSSNIQLTATNVSGSDESSPFDMTIDGIPSTLAFRLDNPVQGGKEVLDQGTEVFSQTPVTDWPAYGAHAQSSANVAGIDTQLSDPLFSPWQRKKDLVYLQGLYPSGFRVQTTYDGVVSMKASNANLRLLEYVFPNATWVNEPGSHLYIGYEVVTERSGENVWYGVDSGSSSWVYSSFGWIFTNPNYEGTDPSGGATNYIEATWAKHNQKAGQFGPQNLRAEFHGLFWDSMDYQDNFPPQFRDDLTTPANIDYLKPKSSGSTDPVWYRNGIKFGVQKFRELFGSDQVMSSNGGRDDTAVNEITADNEWAGFWDHRLSENFQQKIGLEKKDGVNELETSFNNMDSRMEIGLRALMVSAEMVNQTASNKLGKGLVSIDYVTSWSGADPTSISDIPQDFYEAGRFICGLSVLDDRFIAGPCLTRGVLPWPYMDEFVYDPGNPVGGTPSLGSIDNTTTDFTLTVRPADQAPASGSNYGVFWQEFDNVLWVVNLNEPDGNSDWPQAQEDIVTLPSPGGGNVWRFADSTYVNPSRTTGGTACENQSPLVNDGSLVGPTLSMKRWTARMLVRSTS